MGTQKMVQEVLYTQIWVFGGPEAESAAHLARTGPKTAKRHCKNSPPCAPNQFSVPISRGRAAGGPCQLPKACLFFLSPKNKKRTPKTKKGPQKQKKDRKNKKLTPK